MQLSPSRRRKEKKQELPERMRTIQGVRAMLAARKLTRMTSQLYKKKTENRRIWWWGWRTTIITSVVLLAIKGDAYTNECGCPPSSTTCSSLQKLPVQCYCVEESYLERRTEKTCLQWQINALEPLTMFQTHKWEIPNLTTAPSSGHGDDTEINKAIPFKITGVLRQEWQQVSAAEEVKLQSA